jgi:hypothetical protein
MWPCFHNLDLPTSGCTFAVAHSADLPSNHKHSLNLRTFAVTLSGAPASVHANRGVCCIITEVNTSPTRRPQLKDSSLLPCSARRALVDEHARRQLRQPARLYGAHLPHVHPAASAPRHRIEHEPRRRHAVQHRGGVRAQPDALAACGRHSERDVAPSNGLELGLVQPAQHHRP